MSAHLVVPAIDDVPATLSRAQLTGLLRDELGFTGTIVTDALEMKAVSATVGMEEGAVQALLAGADALCLGHDIDEGHVDARPRGHRRGGARGPARREQGRRGGRPRRGEPRSRRGGPRGGRAAVRRARPGGGAARAPSSQGTVADARPLLLVDLEGTTSVAAGLPSHDLGVDPRRAGRRRRGHPHHGEPARPGARGRSREPRSPAGGRQSATSTGIRGSRTLPRRSSLPTPAGSSSMSAIRPRARQSDAPGAQRPHHDVRVRSRQPHGRRRAAARGTVTSATGDAARRRP